MVKTRIERGHRLLENHRQAIAAQIAQGLVGHLQQIKTIEPIEPVTSAECFDSRP